MSQCMDDSGETWIESGLRYIKGGRCPFCGQSLAGTLLVSAYQDFFNTAYKQQKVEIAECRARMLELLSENALLEVQARIASNTELIEFWSKHAQTGFPDVEFETIRKAWQEVRNVLEDILDRKTAAPLERMETSDSWRHAVMAYGSTLKEVDRYNGLLNTANGLIDVKKAEVGTGSLSRAREELRLLKNQQKRHEPTVAKLCEQHTSLRQEKASLDTQKRDTRNQLDEYADQVVRKYGQSINKHLRDCGVGFEIPELKSSYIGRVPRTDFRIQIGSEQIDLGSSDTPTGEASFKNTLSSGDKSAVAFSFFISRLEQYSRSELQDRIIVFDDPASSLDDQRRAYTCRQIIRFAEQCKQVIVLTHNLHLARLIWDNAKHLPKQTLQITRARGDCSDIRELDIAESTKTEYFKCYDDLTRYDQDGPSARLSSRSVAPRIRPFLEGHLRMRFPGDFEAGEWLGDFICKIRVAAKDDPLYRLAPKLEQLTDINDYAKQFHHDQNPDAGSGHIDDGQLRSYVRRTLGVLAWV